MVKQKIRQTIDILKELDIDLWVIFCRESDIIRDPSLDLVVGNNVSGQAALLFSKTGKTEAVVWDIDAADIRRSGYFDSVITYSPFTNTFAAEFKNAVVRFDPQKIALNYSKTSVTADGLTHGMFLKLQEYLKDTPYADRFVSSEDLLFKMRSRKIKAEVERIAAAASMAHHCWEEALKNIRCGMTEKEIAQTVIDAIQAQGAAVSFFPIVNAGTKSPAGHGSPTSAVLEKGDLLHIDFGVLLSGFCSDIQRLAYFKKDNETDAPERLRNAFNMVVEIIDTTSKLYQPGALGKDIDAVARKMLTDAQYPEYHHSLGHQLGRYVHDGGSRVGPVYEASDRCPLIPLEENNVFTVELGIQVKGIGYAGLEEDLTVTKNGGKFLCPRQQELTVL